MVSKIDYDRYEESGSWKCKKSPTGAHHWQLTNGYWVCKHCDGKKPYVIDDEPTFNRQELGYMTKNRVEALQRRRKKDQKED